MQYEAYEGGRGKCEMAAKDGDKGGMVGDLDAIADAVIHDSTVGVKRLRAEIRNGDEGVEGGGGESGTLSPGGSASSRVGVSDHTKDDTCLESGDPLVDAVRRHMEVTYNCEEECLPKSRVRVLDEAASSMAEVLRQFTYKILSAARPANPRARLEPSDLCAAIPLAKLARSSMALCVLDGWTIHLDRYGGVVSRAAAELRVFLEERGARVRVVPGTVSFDIRNG